LEYIQYIFPYNKIHSRVLEKLIAVHLIKKFPVLYGIIIITTIIFYRLCGLVVRVPGYRYRGPGSIPGAAIFSEK
jgi:hypothetical protein